MKILSTLFLLFIMISVSISQNDTIQSKDNRNEKRKDLPRIVTDRPDQTESSSTVPQNTLQIESGVIYENLQNNDVTLHNWAIGTTLLRYGVWDNFELRVGSYYQITKAVSKETNADSTENGLGALLAGFKVYVIEEKGIRPEIAILADITFRHVGSLSYRPTFSYPTAKISFSHTLSPRFSLGYNAGFGYNGEDADGFFIYSVVVGVSITSRLSFFGEAYGTFDQGNLPRHKIDGGFTYLVRNNLQLDISAGTGFDDDIDKSFVSAGFSWRIPK